MSSDYNYFEDKEVKATMPGIRRRMTCAQYLAALGGYGGRNLLADKRAHARKNQQERRQRGY